MPPPPAAPRARWVAGADGYRGGWVAVLRDRRTGALRACVRATARELLALPEAPGVLAIDIPIGLPDAARPGGRPCEALARRLLGPRAPSMFSAPTRGALAAFRAGAAHAAVSRANRGGDPDAPGLSLQTFWILSKIDEVDAALDPPAQRTVREVHPELSFTTANGGAPLAHGKLTAAGRAERAALLERLGFPAPLALLGPRRPRGVGADDLLDACIACWTAGRIADGTAEVLPAEPPLDARGLRMELWR